jgi:DNA-binding XRE family transcriptional regulator
MNPLKRYRERVLMSKAELARKAGISALTIDRVEKGKMCRLETKRKIILALGLPLSDQAKIFSDEK